MVLVVQSNGCPILRRAVPALAALRAAYAPRGVEFLMINGSPGDSLAAVEAEAKEFGDVLAILKDDTQAVLRGLGATRSAEAFVVDPRRWSVVYRGAIDDRLGYETSKPRAEKRFLADALDRLLAGRAVSVPETPVQGCLVDLSVRRTPEYVHDAAPVLARSCLPCHASGKVLPTLDSYEKLRGWGPMIRETIMTERMPGPRVDPRYGRFKGAWGAEDAKLLLDWLAAGAPRGEGEDPMPALAAATRRGVPELSFEAEAEERIPAEGESSVRLVTLSPPAPRDLWIEGIEMATNPDVTHHALAVSLPAGAARAAGPAMAAPGRQLIPAKPGPGYRALPGDGSAFVPKGARLALEVHYVPSGRLALDRPRLSVWTRKGPGRPKALERLTLEQKDFTLPPGAREFKVEVKKRLERDVDVVALWPHMHARGSWMRIEAVAPDGRREILLSAPRVAPRRQPLLELERPKRLEAGTTVVATGAFDNPSRDLIRSGPDPSEEMFQAHVYWTAVSR